MKLFDVALKNVNDRLNSKQIISLSYECIIYYYVQQCYNLFGRLLFFFFLTLLYLTVLKIFIKRILSS